MLDTPYHLTRKMILSLTLGPHATGEADILNVVHGVLYDAVKKKYGLSSDRWAFEHGGRFEREDNLVKARTLTIRKESQADPVLWAMRLRSRDPGSKRRNWTMDIGLRKYSPNSLTLYYALGYFDHLAGSLACPSRPVIEQDDILQDFLDGGLLEVRVGVNPLPTTAQRLCRESLAQFLSLLEDPGRNLPIALVGCPILVDPYWLHDLVRGNLIVYWTDDPYELAQLNDRIPQHLWVGVDSVRVFLPLTGIDEQFHPFFSVADIHRMGSDDFIAGFYQAYCQSLRADDRREFVTLDDILKLQDRQIIATLQARVINAESDLRARSQRIAQVESEITALKNHIASYAMGKDVKDAAAYEELLDEVQSETDRLKAGISRLIASLYSDLGRSFKPDDQESSVHVRDLAEAIHACLSHLNGRW